MGIKCKIFTTSCASRQITIGDLANLVLGGKKVSDAHGLMGSLDWKGFEARMVSVNMCTRHGDLHGENALVTNNNRVMLIDYGSVRLLPSAIDSITLELSVFFHPHGNRDLLQWKPGDGPIDWVDETAFAGLSTIPSYIAATRAWARAEAFAPREVMVCAYIYCLRQIGLSCIDVTMSDRDLAFAIVSGIIERGLN